MSKKKKSASMNKKELRLSQVRLDLNGERNMCTKFVYTRP